MNRDLWRKSAWSEAASGAGDPVEKPAMGDWCSPGADLVVALATLVPSAVVLGIHGGIGGGYPPGTALLYAAIGVAPLMVRRQAPWLCLLLCAAASMIVTEMTMFALPTLVAVYSLSTLRGREQGMVAGVAALASFVLHRIIFGGDLAVDEWATIISLTAFAVAAGL
jgi:hypothetical protein